MLGVGSWFGSFGLHNVLFSTLLVVELQETALRVGLVSEVVPRADLWDRAQQIAGEIAARRPAGVQGTVRAIWESLDMTRSAALQNGIAYTHIGNDLGGPPGTRSRGRKPETR